MAFIDARLSTCVALGFSGGPGWSTLIVDLDNGREQRNAQWLYPKHRFNAEYLNFAETERMEILQAFHACRGQLHAFRFKDHNDYKADGESLSPAIGTSTPVQLTKTYAFGSQTAVRLITAPVAAIVRNAGVSVAGSLAVNTGLFTPSSPWAAGTYTWDGTFDVWVRFASDYNAFTVGNKDAATADVELIEVRL